MHGSCGRVWMRPLLDSRLAGPTWCASIFQALAFLMVLGATEATERPIWGIMTEPSSTGPYSILSADYVKWLEGSGARVIPVFYDAPEAELERIFLSINGLLYPGGGDIIDHTSYYNASRFMFELALKANLRGDYFPVHGTCLGFELLCEMVDKGEFSILSKFDAENISLPLKFNGDPRESRLFSLLDDSELLALSERPLTENVHHYGVALSDWQHSAPLTGFFHLLSTSFDRQGREFVSSIEAREGLPVYAVQWHPERPQFEWGPHEDLDHSLEIRLIVQKVGDFLVEESRRSEHSFACPAAESAAMIWAYDPLYVGRNGDTPQMYFFKPWNATRQVVC